MHSYSSRIKLKSSLSKNISLFLLFRMVFFLQKKKSKNNWAQMYNHQPSKCGLTMWRDTLSPLHKLLHSSLSYKFMMFLQYMREFKMLVLGDVGQSIWRPKSMVWLVSLDCTARSDCREPHQPAQRFKKMGWTNCPYPTQKVLILRGWALYGL